MYLMNMFSGQLLAECSMSSRELSIQLRAPEAATTNFALDLCIYLCYDISHETRAN